MTICPRGAPLQHLCHHCNICSLPQDICIDSFESQLCSIPKEGDEHCDTWNGGNMVKVMAAAALVLVVVQTELQERKSRQLTRDLWHTKEVETNDWYVQTAWHPDKTSYSYSHELRSTISMTLCNFGHLERQPAVPSYVWHWCYTPVPGHTTMCLGFLVYSQSANHHGAFVVDCWHAKNGRLKFKVAKVAKQFLLQMQYHSNCHLSKLVLNPTTITTSVFSRLLACARRFSMACLHAGRFCNAKEASTWRHSCSWLPQMKWNFQHQSFQRLGQTKLQTSWNPQKKTRLFFFFRFIPSFLGGRLYFFWRCYI